MRHLLHRFDDVLVELRLRGVVVGDGIPAVRNGLPLLVGRAVARNLGRNEQRVVRIGRLVTVYVQQYGRAVRSMRCNVLHRQHGLLALQLRVTSRGIPHQLLVLLVIPAAVRIDGINLITLCADCPPVHRLVCPGTLADMDENVVPLGGVAFQMVLGEYDCPQSAARLVSVSPACNEDHRIGLVPFFGLYGQKGIPIKPELLVINHAVLHHLLSAVVFLTHGLHPAHNILRIAPLLGYRF
mmetsp:Transcript_29241/g.81774  ORF Transcript_29241/g.81774 Transcript_29241/m.81774 type:complete len:240 (-) Transcript_29241:84-803(-)